MRLRLNLDSATKARERMIKRMYHLSEPIDFTDEENEDGGPGSGFPHHEGVEGQVGGSKRQAGRYLKRGTHEEIAKAIAEGAISLKLDTGKQSKHHKGTPKYNKAVKQGYNPSIVTVSDDEVARLIEKYSGTGDVLIGNNGQAKETVVHTGIIGIFVSMKNGEQKETNRFTIHYAKNGSHIVPSDPNPKGGKK